MATHDVNLPLVFCHRGADWAQSRNRNESFDCLVANLVPLAFTSAGVDGCVHVLVLVLSAFRGNNLHGEFYFLRLFCEVQPS